LTTKTIITPSLYEFAQQLQAAVQDGYELTEDGAVTWGICYEAQVTKRENSHDHSVVEALINPNLGAYASTTPPHVNPIKKQMGRPKKNP
jgi:hypothetical protein